MFYDLVLCLLLFLSSIHFVSTHQINTCALLQTKLNKYHVHVKYLPDRTSQPLGLCHDVINNTCCPQVYADQIQNATVIELYQLLELYSMNLYEPLLRLTLDFNDTYVKLIENARNDTHKVLQRGYHQLYLSYRLSVDRFFHNLLTLTSRTYQYDIKRHVDELFHEILQISLTLNNNQSILSTYLSCLWRNQPFGNSPTQLVNQLDVHLGKLFQLTELLKLSHELVQVLSTGVTTDSHCIDSYMQLSYCNLCGGRHELPCSANCVNVLASCLVNVSVIDHVWRIFVDATENVAYFSGIEKVLSSIGLAISDAVMTFLNSGGIQNKEIINQCGRIRVRRQTFAVDQRIDDESSKSFLDRQLVYISQTLLAHRLFWIRLPEQICRARGVSAQNGSMCWTGTMLTQENVQRPLVQHQYDKPLSLKLQRILKEMKDKSETIRRSTASALDFHPASSSTVINVSKIDVIIHNFTEPLKSNELDDYPNDNEFDYSDYAYEDSTDQTSTSTTTTTTTTTTTRLTTVSSTTTTTVAEDLSPDDTQTAYYDYGDHDVYSDDEVEESSTTKPPIRTTSTVLLTTTTISHWKERIPFYHRRPPIIWNVNNDDDDDHESEELPHRDNSGCPLSYSLMLQLFIVLVRV